MGFASIAIFTEPSFFALLTTGATKFRWYSCSIWLLAFSDQTFDFLSNFLLNVNRDSPILFELEFEVA